MITLFMINPTTELYSTIKQPNEHALQIWEYQLNFFQTTKQQEKKDQKPNQGFQKLTTHSIRLAGNKRI